MPSVALLKSKRKVKFLRCDVWVTTLLLRPEQGILSHMYHGKAFQLLHLTISFIKRAGPTHLTTYHAYLMICVMLHEYPLEGQNGDSIQNQIWTV